MGKPMVEIACTVRQIREKAIAVADGTTEERVDDRTGEITEREKWTWLAKSQITVEPAEYEVGDPVTVHMQEWMGKEKGLI